MKTTIAALLLNIFFSTVAFCQMPGFNWYTKAGGTGIDYGNALTITSSGDILLTGEFTSTASFGGNVSAVSAGFVDFFLARYTNSGEAVWVKKGGGTLTDRGFAVTTDNQSIFVAGAYYGTANFENITVTSSGNLDAFIARYDLDGNLLWLREVKNGLQTSAKAIYLDQNSDVYTAGYFGGSESPVANIDNLQITTNGLRDAFLAKFSKEGNVLWARSIGGPFKDEEVESITADASGNVYIGGTIADSARFGDIVTRTNGGLDCFIAKYDSAGNALWIRTAGGLGEDQLNGLAIDADGYIYATGYFDSAATFGSTTVKGNDMADIFIAKYDPDGNLLWVRQAGGSNGDYGLSISVNSSGCFITGRFMGTATFGLVDVASIMGSDDTFIAHYDPAGEFKWIKQIGGSDNERGLGLTLDQGGNIYICGRFKGTLQVDSDNLNSSGSDDIFLAKLGNAAVPVELLSFSHSIKENFVKLEWSTASEINNQSFWIERSPDNKAFSKIGEVKGSGTASEKKFYSFTDRTPLNGKNYYRLKQVDFDGTYTFSEVIEADLSSPSRFVLHQNYPNPFNPETIIKFEMPFDAVVSITVFNLLGEAVAVPVENRLCSAGTTEIPFYADNVTSGIYLYTISARSTNGGQVSQTRKMTLLR